MWLIFLFYFILLIGFVEIEKPVKVKIEGRWRLCKVSTRDNDSVTKKFIHSSMSISLYDSHLGHNTDL